MPKMSLDWHKHCYSNSVKTALSMCEELKRLEIRCSRIIEENIFYNRQIHTAEIQGKDGFDSERFLKPRPTTTQDKGAI